MLSKIFSNRTSVEDRDTEKIHVDSQLVYWTSWLIIAVVTPAAILIQFASGIEIDFRSVAPLVVLIILLVAVEVFYTSIRYNPRFSAACGLLAVLIVAGLLAALISHTGIRISLPYVDSWLSRADSFIGIHTPTILLQFARYPEFSKLLATIYSTSLPVCFFCGLVLAASGRIARANELAFAFTFCILLAAITSILLPALGSTVYHDIGMVQGLPSTAGTFHMNTVIYFRDDPLATFDLGKVQGIVTFPSFHMVMAILVPYALRGPDVVTYVAAFWSFLVMLSAVVIGGHYIVDLLAGAATWAIATWLFGSFVAAGGSMPGHHHAKLEKSARQTAGN